MQTRYASCVHLFMFASRRCPRDRRQADSHANTTLSAGREEEHWAALDGREGTAVERWSRQCLSFFFFITPFMDINIEQYERKTRKRWCFFLLLFLHLFTSHSVLQPFVSVFLPVYLSVSVSPCPYRSPEAKQHNVSPTHAYDISQYPVRCLEKKYCLLGTPRHLALRRHEALRGGREERSVTECCSEGIKEEASMTE